MKARPYPRCKFSKTALPNDQLKHIKSELEEVSVALTDLLTYQVNNHGRADRQLVEKLTEEIHDAGHSIQTMLDIMERDYGIDTEASLKVVIKKNRERGYYEL